MIKSGATTGNIAQVEIDYEFNIWSPLAVIRTDPALAYNRFIFYCMKSHNFRCSVELGWSFGTQQNIGMGVIQNLFVTIPPLPEQKAIAAFLDEKTGKIDSLLEKLKRQKELLTEKRTALITRAVTKGLNPNAPMKETGIEWLPRVPDGWEVKQIRRLSMVKRGASPRPIHDPNYFDDKGEYAWVRISDVTASDHYLLETEQKLSKLGKSLSVPLEPNDLFISICASVGKPIIAKIKCCIHDGFVYFPYLKEDREYLYYMFMSGEPYKGLGKFGTQLNLNTDTVGSICIPIPPLPEQKAIAEYLDTQTAKIDLLQSKTDKAIELLKEYRTSLITSAVTGQIKVTDNQEQRQCA